MAGPKTRIVLVLVFFAGSAPAASLKVHETESPGDFALVSKARAAPIVVNPNDPRVVQIAATCLADDIDRVTSIRPQIVHEIPPGGGAVIIRTVPAGKWESFDMKVSDGNLIITGSDRRGTAFGVFELSRAIGVSPWNWWADVPARHRDAIFVSPNEIAQGPPSVKYRGVFLNDEDWGLHPWAAKTFEPEARGAGPKTYAKLFELLLRLKANYCWPAMHECSPAFNADPRNKQIADDYAIVMGSSHCEQMLCNNVTEWPRDQHEKWNPATNLPAIVDYWEKRVVENGKFESVWTVGMRGIHDGGMPGGGTTPEKRERLEHIIELQRGLLAKHVSKDVATVPQIFCPYKEVLDLYRDQMRLPDDITIVWPDDNYGYIRQLPDARERTRAGGSGIYYHLSYNGKPHDYLWLESISPALIWEEITKAYECGAQRLWIANVGDLKPIEAGTTLFLQLAWDIHSYGPDVTPKFLRDFYAEQFGDDHADAIAAVLAEYFHLAAIRKPETLGWNTTYPTTPVRDGPWTEAEIQSRVQQCLSLEKRLLLIEQALDHEYHPAFFELVEYPVSAAAAMNLKVLCAEMSRRTGKSEYAEFALTGMLRIEQLTDQYNSQLDGKWRGMMNAHPRKLPVFDKPIITAKATTSAPATRPPHPYEVALDAVHYNRLIDGAGSRWVAVEGLGRRGGSLVMLPRSNPESIQSAPIAEYDIKIDRPGEANVIVETLPTQPIDSVHALCVGVSLDDGPCGIVSVQQENEENSKVWQANALQNAALARMKMTFPPGEHKLKLWGADASVGVQRITIDFPQP